MARHNTAAAAQCTEARRLIVLDILRSKSRPMSVQEVLEELRQVHAAGNWPQADWHGAINEPYSTGTRQTLEALAWAGACERELGRNGRWWLPTPEELLPQGAERDRVQRALDDYRASTGLDACVGVREVDTRRVIQLDTLRGCVEIELGRWQTWIEALTDAGLIVEVAA